MPGSADIPEIWKDIYSVRDGWSWMSPAFLLFAIGTGESLRAHLSHLPSIVRFAAAIAAILLMPSLSRRLKLPGGVGVLFGGIILGPHVLDIFGKDRPVADFISQLGILLLMFFAGLEVDLNLFRQSERRVVTFGLMTTTLPLVLGTVAGLWFGYAAIPAIVLGSLLASHTLTALPIVTDLGAARLEPIAVVCGATVMSDTLSLVVFAVCVSTYQRGFSPSVLVIQLVEIVAFVLFILLVLSRVSKYVLLAEAYDKRYSPSTFIAEEGDEYRVGWYSNGYQCEKRHTSLADAATDYLLFSLGRERWSPPEL